jgi:ribosome-associated protein
MESLDLAKSAATAAADKKATRPVLLDLRGHSDICDFQFICSGSNNKQTVAIAAEIESRFRKAGVKAAGIEGKQSGNWILMDYGNTLIHIFFEDLRDYYAMESLWPDAKYIQLQDS